MTSSLKRFLTVLDRGLRLQDRARRNAAAAVASDRVAALVRADAAAHVAAYARSHAAVAETRELTLVGA